MSLPDSIRRDTLDPDSCKSIITEMPIPIWCNRYTETKRGWKLSIATHGAPGSHMLSLGGFRIAPEDRATLPGFTTDREAIGLALGMDEKVYWSRLIKVGGPLGIQNLHRIVGGKCVLLPAPDGRIGQEHDFEALDFATACLRDFESQTEVYLTTGQDLGHGIMSDGRTHSLHYLHQNFDGSVLEDTSKPTGEGNFFILKGMLAGVGLEMEEAKIGFIGCGNVGEHLLRRSLEHGAKAWAIETNPKKIEILRDMGVEVWNPKDKQKFLQLPLHAICINASGGSMDHESVLTICRNPSIRVICGSENLAMPDHNDTKVLLSAEKLYCPTELGGMMGYLTAVEEYLSRKEGVPYRVESLFTAAQKLEDAGREAAAFTRKKGYSFLFEDGVKQVYS